MNQKWFIAFYAVWIIRINRCTHNAPHTYAIITIRLFERREAFPCFKCAEQRLRSWASSEADCECPFERILKNVGFLSQQYKNPLDSEWNTSLILFVKSLQNNIYWRIILTKKENHSVFYKCFLQDRPHDSGKLSSEWGRCRAHWKQKFPPDKMI